jgi:hypothetical protein
MKKLMGASAAVQTSATIDDTKTDVEEEGDVEKEDIEKESQRPFPAHHRQSSAETVEEAEAEVYDESFEPRFEGIRTGHGNVQPLEYDDNPYAIDRVNTRESFHSQRVRAGSVSSHRSKKSLGRRRTRESGK